MSPSIVVLACPVCAAPIRPESSRCDFCGSVVVIQTDHPRLEPHLLNKAMIDDHITKFRVRVRHDLNDETAHYGLGVAYFNLGLMEDAADELAQAARLMPENPHIQLQLAIVYADLNNNGQPEALKSAWTRLNRTLLLQPNLADALLLKAGLHLAQNEPKEAVATWRQAEAAQPGSPRESIVSFLKTHKMILQQSPEFSASAAQECYEASIRASRDQYKPLAFGAIVFGVLTVLVTLSANNAALTIALIAATIAAVVAIFQHRKRRWPLESPALAAVWEACDARRHHLVTPQAAMAELFTAADYVAAKLASEIERQRVGTPAGSVSSNGFTSARPMTWETCEIVINEAMFHWTSFEVEVKGPDGGYRLDDHSVRAGSTRRGSEKVVKEMADELIAEGWDPLPKGKMWWSYRFRRPIW